MPKSVLPFLMFQGEGAKALDFYLSIFPDAKLEQNARTDHGTLHMARLNLSGQVIMMVDSPVKHAFTFSPSTSLFLECASEEEVQRLAEALKVGGKELMPVKNYGFSKLFAWVVDRFGISWQLTCP